MTQPTPGNWKTNCKDSEESQCIYSMLLPIREYRKSPDKSEVIAVSIYTFFFLKVSVLPCRTVNLVTGPALSTAQGRWDGTDLVPAGGSCWNASSIRNENRKKFQEAKAKGLLNQPSFMSLQTGNGFTGYSGVS